MTETSGDYTLFIYSIEKLWGRVRNRTVTRTKMLRNDQGKSGFDEMTVTEQERSDFDVLCKRAALVVFQMIQSLCLEVDNAFSYGDGSTSDEITYTTELPLYWDPNITALLDNQIETVLEYWIVKEWFRQVGLLQQLQEIEQVYQETVTDLRSSVLTRRQRPVRKYRIM